MLFKYKGYDGKGKRIRGTISAASAQEAALKLKQQSIYFDRLTQARSTFSLNELRRQTIPPSLLSSFSRELASYLRSGMTILTAIRLLENQYKNERRYSLFLQVLKTHIEEGSSLSQALQSQEFYTFPRFYIKSLDIAAKGGKMEEVLQSMGAYFAAQNRIRKQIKNAMIYPSVIFIVAIAMTGFLISYVVPKITDIFKDTGQELPPLTQFVLHINAFLNAYYPYLIGGFILMFVFWKLAYRYLHVFRFMIDSFVLKLPFFGNLVQNHELGRFSYILSLLLQSGVAYAQAIHLAVASFHNTALKKNFENAAQKVAEGNKLSRALQLSGTKLVKRNFLHALALGEESSEVAEVLINVAKLYGEENDEKIKIALSLLEPLMMLIVGAIVGVIVASMLLPIFTMTKGLQ